MLKKQKKEEKWFFVDMLAAAYEAELCNFNKGLNNWISPSPLLPKVALSKARAKLEHTTFIELKDHLDQQHQERFDPKLGNMAVLLFFVYHFSF